MFTWSNYKDTKKLIAKNLFANYRKSYMGSSKHHEYGMRGLIVFYSKMTLDNVNKTSTSMCRWNKNNQLFIVFYIDDY
jgi:hypothetical protein